MRFISEDTNKGDVKDPLSLNLYAYCQGNPINLVDADGHSPRITTPSLDMSFSEFMSNIISIIPVVDDAKDFHKALTGIDSITGEEISISGRFITLACAAIPFIPGKAGRELIKGTGSLDLSDNALKWLNKGNDDNVVYYGIKKGEEVYTGITKQELAKCLYQHNYGVKGKELDDLNEIVNGLTRNQARAIEQYLIEKGSANALNQINSISPYHRFYEEAMRWAEEFIKNLN